MSQRLLLVGIGLPRADKLLCQMFESSENSERRPIHKENADKKSDAGIDLIKDRMLHVPWAPIN